MAIALSGSLVISGSIFATQGITGSFSGSATSASYADTLGGLPSSSFAPAATFNTVSQSFATTSGSIAGRMTIVEGQDATTGSNTFTGVQYVSQASNAISFTSTASLYTDGGLRVAKDSFVSGTAYFNNITVYGTSSIQYITSSQVNIGSNIITVNTDTPAIRFGGLSVFDSGSTQLTGSLFWDSENNHWIYSNPSGSSYNSAMLMNGPRNTGSLGNEQGTTLNALMKGQGGDHITSSLITETGTATTFYTNALYVTASGNVGIGTTSPTARLDVNGEIRMTGSTLFRGMSSSTLQLCGGLSSSNVKINGASEEITMDTNGATRFTIASTGAATFSSTIAATSANLSGNVVFNRASTSAGNNIEWRTANTLNWYIGTRGLVNNNFYFVNEGLATNNLILDASTGAATFSNTVTATEFILNNGAADGGQLVLASSGYSNWNIDNYSGALRAYYGASVALSIASTGAATLSATDSTGNRVNPFNTLTLTTDNPNLPYGFFGGSILFRNRSYTSGVVDSSRIRSVIYDDGAPNNFGGGLWFETTPTPGGTLTSSLVINYQGRVGIGTTAPLSILHIQAVEPTLRITDSSDGGVMFFGNTGGYSYIRPFSRDFRFVNAAGSSMVTITSGGNVLIGTTSAGTDFTRIATATAGANVIGLVSTDNSSGAGFLICRNSATTLIGDISRVGTTNAVAFNTTSDYRLKEDLKEINGLEKVSAIKVYDFKWKDNDARMDGVIAHELQEILPYAVHGEKDGKEMQGVDYSKIVPVLVKAIQELEARVKELENK